MNQREREKKHASVYSWWQIEQLTLDVKVTHSAASHLFLT